MRHLGKQYVVKGVQVTESGPVAEIQQVGINSKIVHVSEIKLESNAEQDDRLKSITPSATLNNVVAEWDYNNVTQSQDDTIVLPSELSVTQKEELKRTVQQIIKSILSK